MEYISAREAAEKWAITPRRVQILCAQGKVAGAQRLATVWAIPREAAKPKDARLKAVDQDRSPCEERAQ